MFKLVLVKTENRDQIANIPWITKKVPHIQRQRRSPSKEVGGVKLHLESNPIPARDTRRDQTKLVLTRTQRPHRD